MSTETGRYPPLITPSVAEGELIAPGQEVRMPARLFAWAAPLAGLLLLGFLGLALQGAWVALWALSYPLTHGGEYSRLYLDGRPLLDDWLATLTAWLGVPIPPADPLHAEEWAILGLGLAFLLAAAGYLGGVVVLHRGAGATRAALPLVLGFALLFQATLLTMPGIFTTDVFSYLMYGDMAGRYGLNPYVYPPSVLPNHPLLSWINLMWHEQPSVYGPLWTMTSAALAPLVAPLGLVDRVVAYKLLMNVVHLVNLGLVWWLLGRLKSDAPRSARVAAFALFAWNPLLLFEIAGNAHNDGLMVTFLLLAAVPLALVTSREAGTPSAASSTTMNDTDSTGARESQSTNLRWLAALVLLASSALVKFTTIVVAPFFAVAWVRQLEGWRVRLKYLAVGSLVASGVSVAVSWPWLASADALQTLLAAAGGERYLNSLPDLAALAFAHHWAGVHGLDAQVAEETARSWMKVATRLVFALYLGWELRRVWMAAGAGSSGAVQAALEASARALLVLVLLALTWVLPWYFTWALAPAALLGWASPIARLVAVYSVICLPIFYVSQYWGGDPTWGLILYVGLPLLLPLGRWARPRGYLPAVLAIALFGSALGLTYWPGERVAPFCHPGQEPKFVLGFAELKSLLGDTMGEPVGCEHGLPSAGDARQLTTTGVAYYHKSTNTPVFTVRNEHWALTDRGLVYWTGPSNRPPPWAEPAQVRPAQPASR